ncbi:MAG TPA: hypothetical protein DCX14_09350 [Flavobacteriales bacterium]|jgi:hypothetical protein|nr:T9SS type A sorting domain-containing protein [Flavobacteriales bacterium]HAW20376.1 hypothetical protein [Flavobacteriales bacterium]
MKNLLVLLAAVSIGITAQSQCTLSGLNSYYCSSDTISVLTASCNGTPTIFGPGVNSSGNFDPSNAGTGNVDIFVLDGTPSYTIDQVGSYDTIGVPGNATTVNLGDDAVSSNLSIGFSFNFFAANYTTFGISSNGFIFFGSNSDDGCCSGDAIPNSSTPNNFVAFAWEDLDPDNGNSGTISYWTQGVAPNRICVVDFDAVPHYPGTGFYVTSQIKLFEGCGLIEIHTTSMPSDGGTHTMGIENASGSAGYPVTGRNASSWTITNDYVGFIPNCGDTFSTFVSGGPTIALSMDSLACFGDTNGSVTATTSGSAPITYLWSTGDTTAQITNLGIGTYSLTASDSAGCSAESSINMYSPTGIGGSFVVMETLCESGTDGEATVTPNGGTPPYTYAWSSGGTGLTESNLAAGLYTLTITDDIGCDIALNTNVGFENEDPDINLGDDVSICPGQSTVLVATPGHDGYLWSDSSITNAIVVSSAGLYSVTANSAEGCTGSDTVNVTLNIPDQVNLGGTQSGPGPIVLDAGPQYITYFWNTGATTQMLNVALSGDYSVVVQDTNGCVTTDTVKIKIWTTGLNETSIGSFEIYPNPTSGLVVLAFNDWSANGKLTIIDAKGAVVKNQQLNASPGTNLELDLSGLTNGHYILSIETEGQRNQWPIIKQ